MASPAITSDELRQLPPAELERRLRDLHEHSRGLEQELAQQRSELAWSNDRLVSEVYQRHGLALDAERARNIDPATGLPNREAFVRRTAQIIGERIERGEPVALIVIGIDRLCSVRDSLGFALADQVAQRIGERLTHGAPGAVLVARIGDDEFALVLTALSVASDVAALARRLIEIVDGPMRIGEIDLRMMATIGLALIPQDGTQPDALLARAQAAMRFARENGTRLYQFYSASIGHNASRRLRLESELRRGIDRDEFTVHYQPRCKLRGGRRIVGVEALLRWRHPERGIVAAGEFIDVAEETGLLTLIGEAVLRKACADAARWPRNVALSVNLSTREFRGTRLEGMVDRALADSGLAPGRLLVELTEASLQRGSDRTDVALTRLAALREHGVGVILDNFGVDSCNLDLLRRCRAQYIKISAQFVRVLGAEADVFVMVRAISALAHHFGAGVIAEGIEDASQVSAALRAGCSEGQGFHLGRPLTTEQLSTLFRVRRTRPMAPRATNA
ncbi:MAG TPA: bifunctional diguanylate cyclase/phosphodiesterase [Burkholderiaceae bacterium]|nr:bifunctional diguanylate cyclase/phosphodiesterase [Burkholderiaceae bacterium]